MNRPIKILTSLILVGFMMISCKQEYVRNPVVWADIPDISMIRVGDTYYMSSTTNHMNPGLPILKSRNLVDWEIASFAYETLGDTDELNLRNGKSAYGGGSWASSLRYRNGMFYVSTFSHTTGLNYIFSTKDPDKTPWDVKTFAPAIHDHSLFFDDDGKNYMISCGGKLGIRELKEDLSGLKDETEEHILVENADAITGKQRGLPAEGAQMFKVNGKYYIFLITWPVGDMRTVLLYRADHIMGPYEGRVVLADKGVAQGGFIDTPDGDWYGYFFRDYGSVGRAPYIVPMKWEDGWPVFGDNGIVPDSLNIKAEQPAIPAIVASDDFSRKEGERDLPLVWQWNHNPENRYWSVKERPGFLRLRTFQTNNDIQDARNTLTQRTFGPECSAETLIETGNMKNGDFAGIGLFNQQYGLVGISMKGGKKYVTMRSPQISDEVNILLEGESVYLKVDADFKDFTDKGYFYYSTDGKNWNNIGGTLQMSYTIPHFIGYRFILFNYATEETYGYVDFDYFKISNETSLI